MEDRIMKLKKFIKIVLLIGFYIAIFISTFDSKTNPENWKTFIIVACGLLIGSCILHILISSKIELIFSFILKHTGFGMLFYSFARLGTANVNPLGNTIGGRESLLPLKYVLFQGIILVILAFIIRKISLSKKS